MHLLNNLTMHSAPYEFFTAKQTLPKPVIDHIIELFELALDWEVHDSFYKASIADVTDEIEPEVLQSLCAKMAEITGAELSGRVEAKIQKMEPGQYSKVHTDRPLLGYEAARLVVQLNDNWDDERDGGSLRIHRENSDEDYFSEYSPIKNSSFGFVMTPQAHHSVQVTNRERHSVVFYFWHIGNTQEISDWVNSQLSGVNFAELPDYLSQDISLAEQSLCEEKTFRAATVAWLLIKWGCDKACIQAGYHSALGSYDVVTSDEAVLAAMVYELKHESFDIIQWRKMRKIFLNRGLDNLTPPTRQAARICLVFNDI